MNLKRRILQKSILCLCICLIAVSGNIKSQITIGSTIPASKGAILDLKEHEADSRNVTATKGFSLPRVSLTDLESLADISIEDNSSPLKYAGLTIYNTNDETSCHYLPKGVYVWNGSKWSLLSTTQQVTTKGIKTQEDLAALQHIMDAAPTNTLGWTIDLSDIDNPNNYNLPGVTWIDTECGKRVSELNLENKNIDLYTSGATIDFSPLTELKSLNIAWSGLGHAVQTNAEIIDISKNTKLEYLNLANSYIDKVDLSNNINLKELDVSTTYLVDAGFNPGLEKLVNLEILNVGNSYGIRDLDLRTNTKLKKFIAVHGGLQSVDVTGCPDLIEFNVSACQVKNIDVTKNKKLEIINFYYYWSYNLPIDLSNNPELKKINCGQTNITGLDLTNNRKLEELIVGEDFTQGGTKICRSTLDNLITLTGVDPVYFDVVCQ